MVGLYSGDYERGGKLQQRGDDGGRTCLQHLVRSRAAVRWREGGDALLKTTGRVSENQAPALACQGKAHSFERGVRPDCGWPGGRDSPPTEVDYCISVWMGRPEHSSDGTERPPGTS